ncbi:MAG: hypothetical protein EA378_11270 [Phycisphaerales bacterium]|nr:MAG: hypothetical protein EA378_11270 [Phycisphaerales bacterium]
MTQLAQQSRFGGESAFEALEPRQLLSLPVSDPGNTLVQVDTSFGTVFIELFDTITPVTVNNFLNYVNRGDYDGSFFHRLVPGFVLQGGGFTYDESDPDGAQDIPSDPPIVNEFLLPNIERTIAMAKTADPDSATSQFFFNLDDNTGTLDDPANSGGFTVFGRVVGGWDVVLEISELQRVNFGSPFGEVPVTEAYDFANPPDPVPDAALVFVSQARVIGTVGPYLNALNPSPIIGLATQPDGSLLVGVRGENASPVVYERGADADSYTASLLALQTVPVNATSNIVNWVDPKNDRAYAAVSTANGLVLYTQTDSGSWAARNLTSEIPGLPPLSSNLSVMIDETNGRVYLAGMTASGAVVTVQQTGGVNQGGGFAWTFRNLSAGDLAVNQVGTPAFIGELTTYTTPWGGLNITGVDNNGDMHVVWFAPQLENGLWTANNISEISGADPIIGGVTAFVTPWGAINLAGIRADGSLGVTWWTPDFGWITNDLTSEYSGPQLDPVSITSYVTEWGGQNIAGLDAVTGELVVYWWTGSTGWVHNTIADFIQGGAEAPTYRLTGIAAGNGDVSIFGVTGDQRVIEYNWVNADDTWRAFDLSALTRLV